MPHQAPAPHLALLALTVAAATACTSSPPTAGTFAETGLAVTAAVATRTTLREIVSAPGSAVPALAADWTIAAPEPAEIVTLPVAEGDAVDAGDLLVRFDVPSRTQLVAEVDLTVTETRMALDRASEELSRLTGLAERGLVARNDVDAARAARAEAESDWRQAEAGRDAILAQEDVSTIHARFPGTVTNVWHAAGDLTAGPDDPVLRVVDPTRTQIAVMLPIAQRARLSVGHTVTVRPFTTGLDEPGAVVHLPPLRDPAAPTGEVRIGLRGPDALPVDTAVGVEILLEVRPNVLTVPAGAVVHDAAMTPYVMVLDEGLASRRDVQIGLTSDGLVEVVSGLAEAEVVATSGLTDAHDGLPVSIVP